MLLHTWSLSVEEQFYVVLPLLILLLRRHAGALHLVLWAAFALSLAASLALSTRMPEAAFYLFHFRAWELLAGVLLAIAHFQGRRLPDEVQGVASALGVVLLAGSVALIQPGPGFTVVQAIFPVLGTVLILAGAGQVNAVNHVLALRGPVFVGLISYSLYLWHWPVFSLSTTWRGAYAGPLEVVAWIALSMVLAVLSWRFVEQPFRRGYLKQEEAAPRVFGGVALASALALGFAGLVFVRDGVPQRFDVAARGHIAATADFLQDWRRCALEPAGPLQGVEVCRIGPDGPPRVLVWGDSHLRAMMDGIGLAAQEVDVPGILIWTAGCPPLFGVSKEESASTAADNRACPEINARIEAALPSLNSVERVLIVARWSYYAEGQGHGLDAHNRISLSPAPGAGLEGAPDLMAAALTRTVAELSALGPVHVLRQVPEMPAYTAARAARALAYGRDETIAPALRVPRDAAEARGARADAMLRDLAEEGAIILIDPWPRLCDAEACGVMPAGAPVYFDTNHLTNGGALLLRDLLLPALAGAKG